MRHFGRPPMTSVTAVKLDYVKEPARMLRDLYPFVQNNNRMMNFETKKPDIGHSLYKAVIDKSCHEHKVFQKNLMRLITRNIDETGHDPRIDGPPDHIREQVVNTMGLDFVYSRKRVQPKKTPVNEKHTISSLKKQVRPHASSML